MTGFDDIDRLGKSSEKETDSLSDQLFKLTRMLEAVSLFYVKKVAEQINVIGKMNPTSINRMNIMAAVNEDLSAIKKELEKTLRKSIRPLKSILRTALKEDWETESFRRLLDDHPLGEPEKKQLDRMTEMIARQTYGAMENLSNTTAIDRQYRAIVDRAILGVTSGMGSYTEAVRDSIRELGQAGMQVEFASGYHRRLDSCLMQNVTNAAKQISQQGANLCREKMGTDAIELSAHSSPAPDHEPVQGRVFLNAEFAKMQSEQPFCDVTGKRYKSFRRPIGEWNCMHIANPFDTQTSIRTWTDQQLQDMIDENAAGFEWNGKHYTMYEGRQLMRRIETRIRREKDTAIAAKAVNDEILERECNERIANLEKRYADLCETSGQPPQWDRTVVEGFKRMKQSVRKKGTPDEEKQLLNQEEDSVLGNLNPTIFDGLNGKLITEKVFLSSGQKKHIYERHPEAYETVLKALKSSLNDPDIVLKDERHPNTCLVIKYLNAEKGTNAVLRIVTKNDDPSWLNSIISGWMMSKKKLDKLSKKHEILYKRE